MPDNYEQAILDVASHVFETSAFLSVYPLEEGTELPPPDFCATMTFKGAADGRVSMRIAGEVLDTIVDNVLEMDSDPEEQMKRRNDVLKEMLNMLCGNLLTSHFGSNPVFNLSPPEVIESAEMPAPTSEDVHRVLLNIEHTLAEVMFEVQNQKNS